MRRQRLRGEAIPDLFGAMARPAAVKDRGSTDPVTVTVRTIKRSDLAVMVVGERADSQPAWVPLSLIDEDKDAIEVPGEGVEITVPEWLAIEKGLA